MNFATVRSVASSAHTFEVVRDGTRLAVERTESIPGIANRGSVILSHGFAGNRSENRLFDHLVGSLAAGGFTCIRYDWRGLGDSEGDFAETPLGTHVDDLEDLSNKVFDHPLFAVGFSLGAALVASVLARNQDAYSGSVFLSPAVRPCLSMWPRYDTAELRTALQRQGFVLKPDNKVKLGRPILNSLRDTDLGEQAFALPVPLLVVHGTEDVRIPVEHSRQLVRRAPHGTVRFYVIRGAGHSFRPGEKHWPKVSKTIVKWLTQHVGSRHGLDAVARQEATQGGRLR